MCKTFYFNKLIFPFWTQIELTRRTNLKYSLSDFLCMPTLSGSLTGPKLMWRVMLTLAFMQWVGLLTLVWYCRFLIWREENNYRKVSSFKTNKYGVSTKKLLKIPFITGNEKFLERKNNVQSWNKQTLLYYPKSYCFSKFLNS